MVLLGDVPEVGETSMGVNHSKLVKGLLKSQFVTRIMNALNGILPIEAIREEMLEHFSFIIWTLKRIILPVSVLYVILGLVSGVNVLGSLIVSLFIFGYSHLLPDVDLLLKPLPKGKTVKQRIHDKYLVLWLAPLYIYHNLSENPRPVYSDGTRDFHNVRSLLAYGAFLLLIGTLVYYDSFIKSLGIVAFGMLGYLTHLIVDRKVRF